MGSAPAGYLLLKSLPWKWPPKWNGMKATPLPTRSVTIAITLTLPFSGPSTHTCWPSLTPRLLASDGLISTNMFCCSSASHGLERCSSAALVFDESARCQDDRVVLGDIALLDRLE